MDTRVPAREPIAVVAEIAGDRQRSGRNAIG
jgi:hypothetical protein